MTEQETPMEKDIKGYNGLYRISNNGRVFSVRSNKYLKPQDWGTGYLHVSLPSVKNKRLFRPYHSNRSRTAYIHRLVAEHFLEQAKGDTCVNHKNGKKNDNRVENLEWCTKSHDNKHAYQIGLKKPNKRPHYYERKFIVQYSRNGRFIKQWFGIKPTALRLKINRGNITSCLKGRRKIAGGYMWRYTK